MGYKKENINSILTINIPNLIKNYNKLTSINSKTEVAACIKADAYGLGYIKICKVLLENGCTSFFVATPEEALSLRKKFKNINIFLLNGVNDQNTCLKLIKENILIVINNVDQLDIIKKVFIFSKKKIKCAIHIDVGMNRLGFSAKQFKEIYDSIKNYLNIKLVMSHLTSSELKNSSHNLKQLNNFKKVINDFFFLKNMKYSLSNSNGSFLGKKYCFNMVRAGGYLFGLDLSSKNKSKPVISLKAKIIQINNISAGSGVGYGSSFIAKKKSVIATLAIGYADGLPRNYKGYILLNNKKAPFVGNISMDLSCIDITAIANIKVNDWVEIFGKNVSLLAFAKFNKTITYEITSKISNRVKRVYNYNI